MRTYERTIMLLLHSTFSAWSLYWFVFYASHRSHRSQKKRRSIFVNVEIIPTSKIEIPNNNWRHLCVLRPRSSYFCESQAFRLFYCFEVRFFISSKIDSADVCLCDMSQNRMNLTYNVRQSALKNAHTPIAVRTQIKKEGRKETHHVDKVCFVRRVQRCTCIEIGVCTYIVSTHFIFHYCMLEFYI